MKTTTITIKATINLTVETILLKGMIVETKITGTIDDRIIQVATYSDYTESAQDAAKLIGRALIAY